MTQQGNNTTQVQRDSALNSAEFCDIKHYIKQFNFESPDWFDVPEDFPNLSKEGLTKEEGHLLDATGAG